jgi:hypothetical protein
MLPSTHTPIASKYSNWGYICFFGCIALLITLLFFAISQVKQADEVRQRQPGIPAISAERKPASAMQPTAPVATSTPHASDVVLTSFVHTNERLGFSVDFSKVVEVFLPRMNRESGEKAQPGDIRMTRGQTSDDSFVAYSVPGDRTCGGEPCSILDVDLSSESTGESLDQIEARLRSEALSYGDGFAPKIERITVNGHEVIVAEYPDAIGLCDGSGEVSGYYVFLRGGTVVTVRTRCGSIDVAKSIRFSN